MVWTVSNQGSERTSSDIWEDAIYLTNLEESYFLDSFTFFSDIPLDSGENYTQFESVFLPTGESIDPDDEWYVQIIIDDFQEQPETDEFNSYILPINLTVPDVDLVVDTATAPSEVNVHGVANVSWTVTNQGTDEATNFWLDAVYASDDETLDDSDTFLTSFWIGDNTPLASGASYTFTETVEIANTSAGNRYLIFVADDFIEQPETDEGNNTFALPITLTGVDVDLVISALLGSR